jgi:predicted RNase H-like HicB family nuclease
MGTFSHPRKRAKSRKRLARAGHMHLSAVVRQEGKLFVSWCPELDVASQGKSLDESIENLKEAVELYLEDEHARPPVGTPFVTTFEVTLGKASGPVGA